MKEQEIYLGLKPEYCPPGNWACVYIWINAATSLAAVRHKMKEWGGEECDICVNLDLRRNLTKITCYYKACYITILTSVFKDLYLILTMTATYILKTTYKPRSRIIGGFMR
ncbi:hypothetical protein GDO81_010942 [Engystomops pustulosus]|uniref:Uncharacterized protein n=1 Tax=Engystomops pustulosus TaxID=76066 RepID=A0AAV7C3L0_ENGPU|nr:hypothetical protein GDO81_010942 [Engystomops pustulosus]